MNTEDLDDAAGESTGSIEAAASAFEAILAGNQPGTQKAKKDDEADTSDAEEADDDADPDAETASDEDDAEGEADDEQEKKEASSDDEKPVVTIELDGKATELTKKEIEASYLRQADYTRKTQMVAEERRRVAEIEQEAAQERQVYSQLLPVMQERIAASLPRAPDPALIDVNPAAYLKAKEDYERQVGDLQAIQAEMSRLQERTQVEQAQKLQAFVAENAQKLPELVPEWKDKQAYEKDRPKVRDYLKGKGFSDVEINQAYDARLVAIAADGMRYRELLKSRPRADAPLEKALRPAAPPSKPMTQQNRQHLEARKRLAKTGSLRDAASVFEGLI